MKNLVFISVCLIFSIFCLSAVLDDPRRPPMGRTGAPGELTCQTSDCHRGGTFTGTVKLTGMPDTVIAGTKYKLTLTQASNALRAGFEVTALDGSNSKSGNFSNLNASTNIALQSGREYIRQERAVLLTSGSVSWDFEWTAPLTISSGDTIRFYFVSNAANNDDRETGDNTLVSTRTVYFNSNTSVNNLPEDQLFSINLDKRKLNIVPIQPYKTIKVFGMDGKILHYFHSNGRLDAQEILLESGIIVLKIEFSSGQIVTRKVAIH